MVMLWNGFLKVINGKDREKRSKTDAFPNEDELKTLSKVETFEKAGISL